MSQSAQERTRALIFLGGVSVLLVVVAIASLTSSPASATPGVTVTAVILLVGAGYGVVASVVALLRGAPAQARDDEAKDSGRAAE